MKHLLLLPFIVQLIWLPQKKETTFELNYLAQTRGFKYAIEARNDSLNKEIDAVRYHIKFNATQKKEIIEYIKEIDFEKINSSLNADRLAVDAAIQGYFQLTFKDKKYSYEFDHQNLPDPVLRLIKTLENYK